MRCWAVLAAALSVVAGCGGGSTTYGGSQVRRALAAAGLRLAPVVVGRGGRLTADRPGEGLPSSLPGLLFERARGVRQRLAGPDLQEQCVLFADAGEATRARRRAGPGFVELGRGNVLLIVPRREAGAGRSALRSLR